MKRRLTKAKINFLSLCPRGVNRLPVIYKAEGSVLDLDTICRVSKDFSDNGEVTAVVYAPEYRDSQGDIASAAVIKEAMYDAARNGLSLDVRHNEKALAKTDAFIAESFLVQKGDPRFLDTKDYSGAPVDVTGAWAVVLKIENAELRKAYASGEWNGISMGGTAAVEMEKADDVVARLEKLLNRKDEIEMTKEELAANNAVLIEGIAKAVAAAVKPAPVVEAPAAPAGHVLTAPIFKGDRGDPKAVKAHALAVKKYNLAKSVDWNDENSVEAYAAEIEKLDAPSTPATTVTKSEREVELEKELAEERKRSNQPMTKEVDVVTPVLKEADLFKAGKALAQTINARSGYKN